MIVKRILRFSFLFLLFFQTTFAQIDLLEEDFYNQIVINEGILHPVGITFDDNGTGYIWLKRGVVMVLNADGGLVNEPLIDISEEVVSNSDHGLLGFALDPNFLENGYCYLLYTVDRHHLLYYNTPAYDPNKTIEKEASIGRITRYQVDVKEDFKSLVTDSRKILMGKDISDRSYPVLTTSHGVGTIVFGQDGTLLASFGDAAAFERADFGGYEKTFFAQALSDGIIREEENVGAFKAQQVNSFAGKIIRIQPETGEGLPSNPFYDKNAPNAPRSKVWALGLRNPYRFTFKPESGTHNPFEGKPGTFIIGDVGWGKWEEFSVLKERGANFGWPFYEGHQHRWEYWSTRVANKDVKNPLVNIDGCNEFVDFHDLFKEENEQQVYEFLNPCGAPLESKDILTFVHTRPVISYSNFSWNPPAKVTLPRFDSTGVAIALPIEEQNFVKSDTFNGYSAIPGFFYQEGNFPEEYHNQLFLADYSGWIKIVSMDGNDNVTAIKDFMTREKGIVGLAQNKKDGCVYYVHLNTHSINKICFGGNPPPVAKIEADKNYGVSPLEVKFNASKSKDPFGEELTYFWDFGDGNTSDLVAPSFTFSTSNNEPILEKVRLIVTDEIGNTGEAEQIISLNNTPPEINISSFSDGDRYPVSVTSFLPLTAEVSDKEHSEEELSYTWQVFLHHNVHYHPEPEQYEPISQTLISPLGCGAEPYWYRIRLKVKDAAGLESYDEKEIFPFCGQPIFSSFELQGEAKETGNHLTWDLVAQSNNLNKVELYRGTSIREMKFISTVELSETGAFIDKTPIRGMNYYQLKLADKIGVYDFSNLISIEFPPPPPVKVYPNPITNFTFNLEFLETFSETIDVKLFTLTGQQVTSYQYNVLKGEEFSKNNLCNRLR